MIITVMDTGLSKKILLPPALLINEFADYPSQCAAFPINSCTKLIGDRKIWQIKQWWISKNSLYYVDSTVALYISPDTMYVCMCIVHCV